MLPKPVYSKIIQALKKMKTEWDEDRAEDPKRAPYEIDGQLRMTIEQEIRKGKVNCHGIQNTKILIDQTIEYLLKQNIIAKSPYGGNFFPLPKDTVIPTKEELMIQVKNKLDQLL